jgi:hypothetical protein
MSIMFENRNEISGFIKAGYFNFSRVSHQEPSLENSSWDVSIDFVAVTFVQK